MLIVV
jgi:hypothetical protein